MNYNIHKVSVTIDHATVTSNDRRKIDFKPEVLKRYRLLGWIPTARKKDKDPQGKDQEDNDQQGKVQQVSSIYSHFHDFEHKKTRNKLKVFSDRYTGKLYAPNLTVKFSPSWKEPLSYEEVVWVLNRLISSYNVEFNLAEFHVAINIFSDVDDDYFDLIVNRTKSNRKIDPQEHPDYPRTFNYHSITTESRLKAYDKKFQLLKEKIEYLSKRSIKKLKGLNVVRLEVRFNNTKLGIIPFIQDLAVADFSFIYPQHIKFLRPHKSRLRNVGLEPVDYRALSLIELRRLLEDQYRVKHNFYYYLRENKTLARPVRRALKKFRWCKSPDKFPLAEPKITVRSQKVKFTKH